MRLAVLLLGFPILTSAEPNRSWDTLVQTVKTGKKVVVTRMSGAKVEGKLLEITADSITVEVKKQPQAVQRDDTLRVRYADIRRKHTLWGLAIGAGIGALVFAGLTDYDDDILAPFGAGLGAGIGSAVGGSLPIGAPLYEAVKPKKKP
jgi:hypothetical protein